MYASDSLKHVKIISEKCENIIPKVLKAKLMNTSQVGDMDHVPSKPCVDVISDSISSLEVPDGDEGRLIATDGFDNTRNTTPRILHNDRLKTGSSCQALRHAVSSLNRLDDFIREKIGKGFFSEVFKVTHRTTGQVMVLKMNLLRSNQRNMLKEVQLMNKLSHANILGFMGVCVHEGQLHALTEYINGGSLEQLIQNLAIELPQLLRVRLARDISRGMTYLHSQGIFHRDLTSKNVLIKKNEKTNDMTAVVGDFGLAAKIPDPVNGYKLSTVGSPYWMSPECLKGQWYDERSDVFSYGIVLCELIARIDADPDILPRTDNFGLDYIAFTEMCDPETLPEFLKLAFCCCTFEPRSRPTFPDLVKRLSQIIADHTPKEIIRPKSDVTKRKSVDTLMLNKLSGDPLDGGAKMPACVARSEELLSVSNPSRSDQSKQTSHNHKFIHRRSFSEDAGSLIFCPHTAPSDKARCHLLLRQQNGSSTDSPAADNYFLTAKKIGEIMCLEDPHYKPRSSPISKINPFANLAQFRGVKKILGGSPNSYTSGVGDLFSSCFELPSPFFINSEKKLPQSLPGSPTSSRKTFADEAAKAAGSSSTGATRKTKINSLFSHPLFTNVAGRDVDCKLIIKCNSSTNLVELSCDNFLKRRGSCESGFFSSIGEDYHTCPDFAPELNPTRHNISTATLSSLLDDSGTTVSSMRSLDDFDLQYTPTNSIRNVGVDARSIDMEQANRLAIDLELSNQINQRGLLTNQLLYSSKRTSSIYTDSSEDVSSLGGSDIIHWEEKFPGINPQPQQIAKIVEYFERKGANLRHSTLKDGRWQPVPISSDSSFFQKSNDEADSSKSYINLADFPRTESFRRFSENEYHFGKTGLKMAELHKMADGQSISELQRHSRIAALRRNLERHNLNQHSTHVNNTFESPAHVDSVEPLGLGQSSKKCTQRLMICEGAVRSKLPLFDKKL